MSKVAFFERLIDDIITNKNYHILTFTQHAFGSYLCMEYKDCTIQISKGAFNPYISLCDDTDRIITITNPHNYKVLGCKINELFNIIHNNKDCEDTKPFQYLLEN